MDFELQLSNPSTLAEQQKLELFRTKFEIMSSPPEGLLSRDYLRREVMGLTKIQIKQIEEELQQDKQFEIEMADIELAGGGSGGSSGGGGLGGAGGGLDLGGDEGEEPAGGGAENEPPDEAPDEGGDEPAGDEKEKEGLFAADYKKEKGKKLLVDDDSEDLEKEIITLSLKDENAPIKALSQAQRVKYNRKRIKHHGAKALDQPDFNKMLSAKNKSMSDPYDREHIKNPFKETRSLKNYYDDKIKETQKMDASLKSVIDNLKKNKLKGDIYKKDLITENLINDEDEVVIIEDINDDGQ